MKEIWEEFKKGLAGGFASLWALYDLWDVTFVGFIIPWILFLSLTVGGVLYLIRTLM